MGLVFKRQTGVGGEAGYVHITGQPRVWFLRGWLYTLGFLWWFRLLFFEARFLNDQGRLAGQ